MQETAAADAELAHCDGSVFADVPCWSDMAVEGWIGDALAALSPQDCSERELLDASAMFEKLTSWVIGNHARFLAEFAARRDVELESMDISDDHRALMLEIDDAADEMSLALNVAPTTARHRMDFARELSARLPRTLSALCAGSITASKARVIADQGSDLSDAQLATLEERVLDWSADRTPGQLRDKVRREIVRIDADALHRRAVKAAQKRAVELIPRPDGMATLSFQLPGADAVAAYNWLDERARAGKAAGDSRTLDQLRADALIDLVCERSSAVARRPLVRVLVPAATVAGGNAPGELAGYGVIDAELARQLAADGVWQRILTDPISGTVTDVDPTRYTPPAALKSFIEARDRTCRFPTCRQPAHRCDIDHTIRFRNGFPPGTRENPGTGRGNLGALCRRHHRLKDRPGTSWRLRQSEDGRFTWTTPTGRTVEVPPDPAAEPALVQPQPAASPGLTDTPGPAITPASSDPPPF